MINNLKILLHQGKQFIPDLQNVQVPGIYRGRPVISREQVDEMMLLELCPTGAISAPPVSIDLGKCTFCGECARCFPGKITFTRDYKLAVNERKSLIITEGEERPLTVNQPLVRKEVRGILGKSLKVRQVSAGGDNSAEWELNAANNVQFDGIVITGPVTENMAEPLQICHEAIPEPKIVVLAGTDAISGGIFEDSPALNRTFLDRYPVDLYLPGNPPHPLTIINGLYDLTRG